ncbi:MAG: helix-turn-helix domain-containing protein [Burkholderiales bacterium]|nr:helix-turn-helix domain-containing protein [Burkholderiales bacterium]
MAKSKYTYEQLKAIALEDPATKQAYDQMEYEFDLLKARIHAGKTQDEVAEIMHTSKSAVSRLENNGGKTKHSPSLETLRRYAEAVGYELKIQLIPKLKGGVISH